MGIVKIIVCDTCKTFINIDKSSELFQDFQPINEFTIEELNKEPLSNYQIYYLIKQCKFLWIHKGHIIRLLDDTNNEDEYFFIKYGKSLDQEIDFKKDSNYKEEME